MTAVAECRVQDLSSAATVEQLNLFLDIFLEKNTTVDKMYLPSKFEKLELDKNTEVIKQYIFNEF